MGTLEAGIIPVGEPTLWALIGMTAVLGGTMRSPFTCIIFALELTHDMNALLPLMVAAFVAAGCTVLLLKRSVLTEKVARRGHHVTREYSIDPLENVFVEDVMTHDVHTLSGDMTLGEAVRFFDTELPIPAHVDQYDPEVYRCGFPVVDAGKRITGVLTRADVLRLKSGNYLPSIRIADVAPKPCAIGYPDQPVSRVADRMAELDADCVPILDPRSNVLIGLVTRHDVLRARAHMLVEEHVRERIIDLHLRLPRWLRGTKAVGGDAGNAVQSGDTAVGRKPQATLKRGASKHE